MGVYGQDWASYQSAAPDTTGLSFAFVKITEGATYTNPQWQAQRDHAKAKGLVFGGYHYPHMGQSVQLEADHFLAQVAWQPGDLVCLDWEGYDAANTAVPHARQVIYKDQFLRYVKSHLPHNPVGMYANTDYWLNVDTTGYYGDFLWIATAGLPAGQPGIKTPWLFHQYAAATVDHDYCPLPTTQALRDWALSFSSTPPEPDMPLSPDDIKAIWAYPVAHKQSAPTDAPTIAAGTVLGWMDYERNQEVAALTAQNAGLTAAIAAVAKAVTSGGGLTAAQVTAAAQAGAVAALTQLGHVLDGTK